LTGSQEGTCSDLVIGGDSFLGAAIAAALTDGRQGTVVKTSRRASAADTVAFDLRDDPARALGALLPATVYLCAGITSISQCEDDPAGSRRVNVEGMVRVARFAHARGSFIIYLSSNAVFDGHQPRQRMDAEPGPASEYGRQKRAAEEEILALGDGAAVVRLTKVVAAERQPFSSWLSDLSAQRVIYPFSDRHLCPISTQHALRAISVIRRAHAGGILHVSGESDCSYGEFAARLADRLGVRRELVVPRKSDDAPGWRARYSSLDVTETAARIGIGPQSLPAVLADLIAAA